MVFIIQSASSFTGFPNARQSKIDKYSRQGPTSSAYFLAMN